MQTLAHIFPIVFTFFTPALRFCPLRGDLSKQVTCYLQVRSGGVCRKAASVHSTVIVQQDVCCFEGMDEVSRLQLSMQF